MTFSTRPARIDDLDILLEFVLAEATEAEGITKVPDTVREGIRRGLEDPSIARYWVLQKDLHIVGSISIVREWSDWHATFYWWIQSMFLRPSHRGQGLMFHLLKAVKAAARAEKVKELRLYVHKNNQRAIKAYRRDGFGASEYEILSMELDVS